MSSKKYVIVLMILIFSPVVFVTGYMREQILKQYYAGITEYEQGNYQKAIELLQPLGEYKDSVEYVEYATNYMRYNTAKLLFNDGHYEEAVDMFSLLHDYEDSQTYIEISMKEIELREETEQLYDDALFRYESEDYEGALSIFSLLGNYKSSDQLLNNCRTILRRLENSNTISAGTVCSGGVTQDGRVYLSGEHNIINEIVENWNDIISISIMGEYVIGLKRDGTVVFAGQTRVYDFNTSSWDNIIAVSAGSNYIVGLREDGTVIAQGHNGDGQIEIDGWKNIKSIATGWRTTAGLDFDGNIYITGYRSEQLLNQINSDREVWSNIVAISVGGGTGESGHIVGLKKDGTVVAAGNNVYGQCDVNEWTDIVAISAGDFHTVGLKSDGTVVTTSIDNEFSNEIVSWSNILAVSAGYNYTLGLRADGTVVGSGFSERGQIDTDTWTDIAFREEWGHVFNQDSW